MSLKKLSYREFEVDAKYWELKECEFVPINLIVGKNATGKSRLINVLSGFCALLAGTRKDPMLSGAFEAEVVLSGKSYLLSIQFENGQVKHESLKVDGDEKLFRDHEGKGHIWYEKEKTDLSFEIPKNVLALQQRRDTLQHPFMTELVQWAQGCQTLRFSKSFPSDRVIQLAAFEAALSKDKVNTSDENTHVTYIQAYEQYKDKFDKAIIRDMKSLGYNINDIGMEDLRNILPGFNFSEPLLGLYVVEADRLAKLPQNYMSDGMLRALYLCIHLNAATFGKQKILWLIDDIGEGLDFERATKLIDVVVKHAKRADSQVLMTSNDRFVMNSMPLEHWTVLSRKKAVVSAHNERNSKKIFDDFKFMGLSNFDFFTSVPFR